MSSPSLAVRQLPTAASWLAATASLRSREPVLMNLPGSVAEGVVAGARYDSELWLVVEGAGQLLGCAVRTAPWPAVLAPMHGDVAVVLGEWMAANATGVTALTGPASAVSAVARGMGRTATVRMRENVRVLGALASPLACDGHVRPASDDDIDLLIRWFADFHDEAGLPAAADARLVQAAVTDRRLWLWVNGSAVAMGGHARVVSTPGGTVGRIGPVYTAPGHRQRGYGSALTHAIARTLATSCDQVMLFADADNQVSNSIYERLGFGTVTEIVEVDLA